MKKKIDLRQHFSKFYQDRGYLNLFIKAENRGLPPLQKSGMDHGIDLKKIDGRNSEVLWKSLYNMSREELLILKKKLIKLLNKGFIQVNKLVTEALVLFV